jgi:hypothetical protein
MVSILFRSTWAKMFVAKACEGMNNGKDWILLGLSLVSQKSEIENSGFENYCMDLTRGNFDLTVIPIMISRNARAFRKDYLGGECVDSCTRK